MFSHFIPIKNRWQFYAALGWLSVTVLWASRWYLLPLFLDAWYHLLVLQEFLRAGGIVLQDMFQVYPQGGWHLYPPLLHLLMAVVWRIGVRDPLTLIRLFSVLLPSCVLWVWWQLAGRLLGWRCGAWALLAMALSSTFIQESSITLSATLALVLAGGCWWAIERGRWLAGGLCLGLMFYAHWGLPWFLILVLGVYGALERRCRQAVFATCGIGLLVGAPWWLHVLVHRAQIPIVAREENQYVRLYLLLAGLAAIGCWAAWTRGGRWRFPVVLCAALLPALPVFSYRVFNNQGILPLALLAAIGCEHLCVWVGRRRGALRTAVVAGLAALACSYPSVTWDQQGIQWHWFDSGILGLTSPDVAFGPKALPIYSKWAQETAGRIREETQPAELVTCSFNYVGFMLGVLAERSVVAKAQELEGVEPRAISMARTIVWVKDPDRDLGPSISRLAQRYGLQPAGETALAYVLRNPLPTGRRMTAQAAVPWPAALGLLLGVVGLIGWDLRRGAIPPPDCQPSVGFQTPP